jgi:hypothetical protein
MVRALESESVPGTPSQYRLLVCGWIDEIEGELARGMPVLAQDGSTAGVVAAVVLTGPAKRITHLLLGQVPPTAVYRLVPIALIDHVAGERLWLQINQAQIHSLPLHDPDNSEGTR